VIRPVAYTVFTLALLLVLAVPAHAYVDPGSGLLICQSAGTVCAGILFYFRRRLKCLFNKSPNKR
jgi:hypothetical protein